MLLTHLRSNAVAYLALAVALTTGTAYAADRIADGSVTAKKLAKNSVTGPKIKANAVRSSDVKNGSLRASDLAVGVLPPTIGLTGFPTGNTPVADPHTPNVRSYPFTTSGSAFIMVTFQRAGASCGGGGEAGVGFYLDGTPVPNSYRALPTQPNAAPLTMHATVQATPGAHTLSVGLDCVGTQAVIASLFVESNAVVMARS